MRVILGGLLVVAALAASGAAPAPAAESGINIALHQTVDGPSNAQRLRVGWVRIFVGWSLGEPSPGAYDRSYLNRLADEVRAYKARGVKTLFVVQDTPAWAAGPRGAGPAPPADADTYARFVAELARVACPGAIEIWNEADSEPFWRGAPDPAGYTALLRAAYPRIKATDPNVTVVTSGMVGNHYEFLQGMYASGAAGSFDAVGVHTDTACLLTSPAEFYREPNGRVGRFSFTGYREVHDVMTANGDGGKGVWMTEIGWNTGSRKANSCRDGAVAGTRAEGVSEKTQARFLELAYRCLAADRAVRVALWFSLQDVGRRRRLRRPPRPRPARAAGASRPTRRCARSATARSARRAAAAPPTAPPRASRSAARPRAPSSPTARTCRCA